NWRHAALALSATFLIWLLLFSSLFTHFAGLLDSIRTYLPWLRRAGGHSPHIHPWNFYLQRLAWFHPATGPVWSEGLILILAVVGAVASLVRSSPSPPFAGGEGRGEEVRLSRRLARPPALRRFLV